MQTSASLPVGPRPRLMVVHEEGAALQAVHRLAAQLGVDVEQCASGRSAVRAVAKTPVDLALIDLRMPGVNGLAIVQQIRGVSPGCEVILVGGRSTADTADTALQAVRMGAHDYWTRPWECSGLRAALIRVRDQVERQAHVFALDLRVAKQVEWGGMIGRSPAMQEVFSLLRRLAPHANVLLLDGEPGTGKERAARAFHQSGPRRTHPFVAVACASIPSTLDRPGDWLDRAEGGTLFLDAVGALAPAAQAALVGAIEAGASVVAATHRDLRAEVAAGRVNPHLFERLDRVRIALPPLRGRREDIPPAIAAFVRECARESGRALRGTTGSAERLLVGARWNGNVGALRQVIARACSVARGPALSARDLDFDLDVDADASRHDAAGVTLGNMERDHIVAILDGVGGNRMAAAKMLGISRRALYRRLDRHRITRPAPARGGGRPSCQPSQL